VYWLQGVCVKKICLLLDL